MKRLDVAIVGGGPSGMAAALALQRMGVSDIKIFERLPRLGGVLPQCIHYGFGLEYFSEELTGPEFAARQIGQLRKAGIPYALNAMVTAIADHRLEVYSAQAGREVFSCGAILLATGCRERTRENLDIPGDRPAGIFMAGQAQALINLGGVRIGQEVVIQGSGDIGLIMARRLTLSGCNVLGVYERLPYLSGLLRNKVQCLDHFGIPLHLNRQIVHIRGRNRVEGVTIAATEDHSHPQQLACDTIVFAAGLIPEIDLYLQAGGRDVGGAAKVNQAFLSEIPGVFVAGNALHINELADNAAMEAEACAASVFRYLRGEGPAAEGMPYQQKARETRYDASFFAEAAKRGVCVCILCPKSCFLGEGLRACPRGKAYYEKARSGNFQKLTRTRVEPDQVFLEGTPEIAVSQRKDTDFIPMMPIE